MADNKQTVAAPAKSYYDVFQGTKDGQEVLDDLSRRFYDRTSVSEPVDPNKTLVLEGQRQVILFIIAQCAEGQK